MQQALCRVSFVSIALVTVALHAQPAQRKAAARPASSEFGAWLDPNREAPAGMKYGTFASKLAGTDVSYVIYLPPGYETDTNRRYPVVYWLHGRGGSQTGAAVFAGRLGAAIQAGKAPATIVVGVNGRKTGSWVDTFDGKSPVQSVIIKELIPHIDATYRTIATREARAIEGFSMGGAGAPKIGFKYPELFGAVGVISGALHDLASYSTRGTAFQDIYGGNKDYFEANDPWSVLEKNADAIRGRTFVRVAVGAKDNLLEKNTAYHERLEKLRIGHAFDVVPDAAHNAGQVYDGLGDKTWEFYTRAFAQVGARSGARNADTPTVRPRTGAANETATAGAGQPRTTAASGRIPEGTKAFRDLAYVTNGHERQKLDLYIPERAGGPTPLVIWVHGGGWAAGDKKEGGPPLNSGYTRRGYAVASLNYRLSGDAIFPAQIEDCKAAIRWLRAHAKEYNLDPAHIGVWGSSAGGHLVALLGTTGGINDFDVGENLDQSSAVQAVCDYYGPTDLLQMDAHALPGARLKHDAPNSPESRLVGGPLQEKPYRDRAARINPITFLSRNAPPFLIVHGDQDPTVPHHQSELLFAALEKSGVPVRFHTIKGAGHGAGFGGREIGEMVAAFFDHHLLGQRTAAADWPAAMTSDSVASPMPPGSTQPVPAAGTAPQRVNQGGAPGPWQRPTWDQILARDDANRDGKVMREEFKGPAALFARLDRNGDGVFTREEYDAGGPRAAPGAPLRAEP